MKKRNLPPVVAVGTNISYDALSLGLVWRLNLINYITLVKALNSRACWLCLWQYFWVTIAEMFFISYSTMKNRWEDLRRIKHWALSEWCTHLWCKNCTGGKIDCTRAHNLQRSTNLKDSGIICFNLLFLVVPCKGMHMGSKHTAPDM